MSQITLERLRYFIEVAQMEHVGNAAKSLAVSPSVISSAVATLEEELGNQLFIRDKNRIKLNEKGHLLLEKAKAILESTKSLYSQLANETLQLKGHFKVGGSHFLLQEYLIPCFLDIQKTNKELTAEFVALDTGMAANQVMSGGLDAALVFRSISQFDLNETILHEGQFEIVVKAKHSILNLPKKQRVSELNQLPAITFKPLVGVNYVENHPIFEKLGLIPKHAYFYEDHQSVFQLLEKTNGWAFLPSKMVEKNKKITSVFPAKSFDAPVKVSLLSNKNRISSYFVDKLKEQLQIII